MVTMGGCTPFLRALGVSQILVLALLPGRDAWLCVRGLLHQANSADSVNS
eukprot:SAG25_NODE_733_length_5663_cov_27.142523_1_plen_50_part_00